MSSNGNRVTLAFYRLTRQHRQIVEINNTIEHVYLSEKVDSLINLYHHEATFFPEYKPAIFDITKLRSFYQDWFKAIDIKAYTKKIYKVEVFSDYILEIGNFSLDYLSVDPLPHTYSGKYMVLWKSSPDGKLSIISETFGSDKYLEPENVPYADVQIEEKTPLSRNEVSRQVEAEIEEFNAEVIKAVEEGNGEARASGFTKDGIYMPHFDAILVGMEVIRPYMLKIYKPGGSLFVKHTYQKIYDLGNFVFVNGHFKGSWGKSMKGGTFEGNMSNLMKRNEQGKLLMYRQLANNDR